MGVYGNIHGAFNGLGKPSIKLEFEDNESLVAFSKKMQDEEPAPVQWNEEEEMFVPVEGVKLSEKDFFDVLEYNTEPYIYRDFNEQNVISVFGQPKHRKDSFGNVKYAFEINTPLKGSESKVYIWKDMNHALFDNSTKEDRSRFWTMIKPTIERPAIVFEKDGKNHFVKCFKTSDGQKVHFTFIPALVNEKNIKTFIVRGKRTQDEIYKIYNGKKGGGSVLKYLVGSNATINGADWLSEPILFVECRLYADKDNSNISENQIFNEKSLDGYGDFYTVRDMRKRSRKEPGDVAANKNLQFTKDNDRKINNFDRSLYELTNGVNSWNYGEKLKDTHWRTLTVKYNSDNGKYFTTITLFFPYTLRRDLDKPTFTGYASGVDVDVDLNNLYNYSYYIDSRNYVDRQRLEGFVKDDYYKTLLIEAIKSGYKQLQQRLINAKNSRLTNTPSNIAEAERLIKYYKMLYSDPSKYDLLDKAYGGGFKNISNKLEKFLGEGGLVLDGLGKTANNTLYNNLEILDFRGMQPTYRQLPNYDEFFKPATNKNSLKGWGLNDTKKLIADICRNHYKECAAIAKHLKAETKLQSAFNLWHWLHHNVRYEYDREGREEVRTPSRVWADRHRGVDCDCLAVFTACLFRNKPAYSHIYINLDGIVIDRVWYVFNSRPPGVTKTELFKVGMLDNLGQLF